MPTCAQAGFREAPACRSRRIRRQARQAVPLNIMVADHDPGMRRTVSDYLGQNNMRVAGASGKQDMSRLLAAQQFSMVVLDLQLGQENGQQDGLDLLRELRAHSDMPVITLAGRQHDEIDRIVSLELGADDCLAKPFSLRELLARIKVVLRRAEAAAGEGARELARDPGRDKASARLRFGPWTLDRRTRRFAVADGDPIPLTKGEYAAAAGLPRCAATSAQPGAPAAGDARA